MPRHKLWRSSKTPLDQPSRDPDDVLACFRRIKKGPTLGVLRNDLRRMQRRMERYERARASRTAALALSKDQSDFDKLEDLQGRVNDLKIQMIDMNDRIARFQQCQDSPATELKTITDLPQVIGIRAETPETIVITVVASVSYACREYHLGTWDIYFGKLEGLMRDGKPLITGKGDRSDYRIRRVYERCDSQADINYYNYDDGSFCFDKNSNAINELAHAREYLHAIQLMLTYLSWVGESKRSGIPDTFPILEERHFRP